jgi:hypothetical protein
LLKCAFQFFLKNINILVYMINYTTMSKLFDDQGSIVPIMWLGEP